MPWFDDPAIYYRAGGPTQLLSQGDIVIAPTATIIPGFADVDVPAPMDLDVVRRVALWRGAEDVDLPAAPSLSAEVRWGPAMVLPHSCALDKEWNERIEQLIADGTPEFQAVAEANADAELGAHIVLAPILAIAPETGTMNTSVDRFPVPANASLPASFVDLNRMTTVRFELLAPTQRIYALSDLAIAHLGHRLANFFAYRAKSKLDDIERAIGLRIVDMTVTPKAKGIIVGFILEDGSTLVLEGDRNPTRAPGPERVRR